MKATNYDSILNVMSLFDNEDYYKYAIKVMWVLRGIICNKIECKGREGYYYDHKHPDYWIYAITNEIIGRSYVEGYRFIACGKDPYWDVSNPRIDNGEFLTYEEAKFIAEIGDDPNMILNLLRLKGLTSEYANNTNHPVYHIYKVASDLLGAINQNKCVGV